VLLDECVPRRLAQALGAEHSVATVTGLGWAGTTNGELLRLAVDHDFEAFVTVDVGLHVSPDAPLRVLVLRAGSNRLEALLPLMPSVLEQLATLPPGRTEIIAPRPPRLVDGYGAAHRRPSKNYRSSGQLDRGSRKSLVCVGPSDADGPRASQVRVQSNGRRC
jgi:hypothetical protein